MPFVHHNGRDIYYERSGAGPAVLFCHGAGSNAATWWQQLPVFAARYTCVAMDLRCFGRSVAPASEFRLQNFVDDVVAVLDQENIAQAAIVGQSLGGMVGLRVALQHPGRVSAFVACGTSLAIDHPVLRDSVQRHLEKGPVQSIEQRAFGTWFNTHHPALAGLYGHINRFNPSSHSIPKEAWAAAMFSLNAPENLLPTACLRDVARPTLFILGVDDPVVPVQVVREIAPLVPGSEVVVLERAAHSAYFEQAEAFNRHVLDFLGRKIAVAGRADLPG